MEASSATKPKLHSKVGVQRSFKYNLVSLRSMWCRQVSFHGLVIVSLFAWTALVGSIALLGPSLPLLLIPLDFTRKLYRRWSGFVALMWFSFATLLLERYGKVRLSQVEIWHTHHLR